MVVDASYPVALLVTWRGFCYIVREQVGNMTDVWHVVDIDIKIWNTGVYILKVCTHNE